MLYPWLLAPWGGWLADVDCDVARGDVAERCALSVLLWVVVSLGGGVDRGKGSDLLERAVVCAQGQARLDRALDLRVGHAVQVTPEEWRATALVSGEGHACDLLCEGEVAHVVS